MEKGKGRGGEEGNKYKEREGKEKGKEERGEKGRKRMGGEEGGKEGGKYGKGRKGEGSGGVGDREGEWSKRRERKWWWGCWR